MRSVVFGISGTEFLLIGLALLLLFGPEHLPRAARELGRVRGQLRRMTGEVERAIREEGGEPPPPPPPQPRPSDAFIRR